MNPRQCPLWLATLAVVVLVAACGGGGSTGNAGAPGSSGSSGSATASGGAGSIGSSSSGSSTGGSAGGGSSGGGFDSSIVWTPAPSAPGAVTVLSPDTAIAADTVVSFGQVFPAGEIASGAFVQASLGGVALPTQTDIKRRHPDGSVRHAVLSVRLPATSVGSGQASLNLALASSGSHATGAPLALSAIASGPVDYRVEIDDKSLKADGSNAAEYGKTWITTLKGALSGTTERWLDGALASEWRARVAPQALGADHPGLRIIFDARYQSSDNGRVSITTENVESSPARGDRIYDIRIYRIDSGGTQLVYNRSALKHHAHTRLRKVFHFGTDSKPLLAIVDSVRLKTARAIPNYADVSITPAVLSQTYADWQASQRDIYQHATLEPYMGTTGGRWDIGPLPGWTALSMITGDPRMYQIMLDYAERAGHWSVHWRDSLLSGASTANARVFSVDDHPNFSLFNPSYAPDSYVGSNHLNWMGDALPPPLLPLTTAAGTYNGNGYNFAYDTAHEPSLSFVPYLVTGDRFYLDELYFYAAWPMISYGYQYRGNDKGLYKADAQVRGQAWGLRTLGHAAWIAPDASWHKTYFNNKLDENLNWYRSVNMVDAPLGWVASNAYNPTAVPYANAATLDNIYGPWQHAFMAYTLSELSYKGFNATDVRDWALGLTVKLFTSPDNVYNKFDGTAYYVVNRIKGPGGSSVMLNDLTQVSQYTFANRSSAPTAIEGAYAGGYGMMAFMALATAVDANLPNASQGFVFVRNQLMATHTNTIRGMQDSAVFNIVPFGPVTGLSVEPGIAVP